MIEMANVAVALGSAIVGGIVEQLIEEGVYALYENMGEFPPGIDPIYVNDLVGLGAAGAMLAAGVITKIEPLTFAGIGGLATGITQEVIEAVIKLKPAPLPEEPAARIGLPRGRYGAPKQIPGVLMPKFQYGDGNPIGLRTKARLAGGLYPGYGIVARGYTPRRPGLTEVVGARGGINVGPYAGGITAPKFIPGPLRPKYQHGA